MRVCNHELRRVHEFFRSRRIKGRLTDVKLRTLFARCSLDGTKTFPPHGARSSTDTSELRPFYCSFRSGASASPPTPLLYRMRLGCQTPVAETGEGYYSFLSPPCRS